MSVALSPRSNLHSMLNISRPNFARIIGSLMQNPYVGTLGVFLGAGIVTLNGRLISVGLPDLRGAMGLGIDDASWIPNSFYSLFDPLAHVSKPASHALLTGGQRPCLRHVLSVDPELCPPRFADALRDICDRHLFDGYCWRNQHRNITRSLVCRALIMALDLLAKRIVDSADDALHLPGHLKSAAAFGT